MESRRSKTFDGTTATGLWVIIISLAAACLVGAEGNKTNVSKTAPDVESWGQIGKSVRGAKDFYEITYSKRNERGKRKKTKAFLRIPSDLPIYEDRLIRWPTLEPAATVAIFGKVVKLTVPEPGEGRGQKLVDQFQIRDPRVLLAGDVMNFRLDKKFKHSRLKGYKWLEGRVSQINGGFRIEIGGTEHHVKIKKETPILLRQRVDRKRLKKKLSIRLVAHKIAAKPVEKPGKRESFEASQLVVIPKGLATVVYPMVWGRGGVK